MTRADVLVKLLAHGELRFVDLVHVCGWPRDELSVELQSLRKSGRLTRFNANQGQWYRLARVAA